MLRIFLLIFCLLAEVVYGADVVPESGTGFVTKEMVVSDKNMVVAAHPLASRAALLMLERGGSAVDAVIAAQMVLNVVEPQSSGIGGGGFLLHYDAVAKSVVSFDGREVAPRDISEDVFRDENGRAMPFMQAVRSGAAVGVPGLLKMLAVAHKRYGVLQWEELFVPAIDLARHGFEVSERLNGLLSKVKEKDVSVDMRDAFFDDNGKVLAVGKSSTNEVLAGVFDNIARQGVDFFYDGKLNKKIVKRLQHAEIKGYLKSSDLSSYEVKVRKNLCGLYHGYRVCGMGPPSSGGIAILQILGMLEQFDLSSYGWMEPRYVHVVLEVMKLAYADRNKYVADSDFVDVPLDRLLDADYLKSRAKLIDIERASDVLPAGRVAELDREIDYSLERLSTTHISVVDFK